MPGAARPEAGCRRRALPVLRRLPAAPTVVLLLLLGLAACAPRFAPPGPGPAEPLLALSAGQAGPGETTAVAARLGSFRAADGLELPLRAWLPGSHAGAPAEPGAVVLALHGFNDYANAFAPLGEALAPAGIAVYAYDQRGFGAGPSLGLWAGTETLAGDLRAAVAALRQRHPGLPLYVLGESMGGAVVLAAEAEAPGVGADGLLLSAPAVWARRTQPWYQRAGLWLALRTLPWLKPSARNIDRLASDNLEMLRALGRDPLVQRGARIDTLAGLVDLMDAALAAAPRVATPTLLLYGEKDEIIPAAPVERLWAEMPAGRGHRYLRYPAGWHLLTRDLQGRRVIEDIAAWIQDPAAPPPSAGQRLEWGEGRAASR